MWKEFPQKKGRTGAKKKEITPKTGGKAIEETATKTTGIQ